MRLPRRTDIAGIDVCELPTWYHLRRGREAGQGSRGRMNSLGGSWAAERVARSLSSVPPVLSAAYPTERTVALRVGFRFYLSAACPAEKGWKGSKFRPIDLSAAYPAERSGPCFLPADHLL